jgi:hypothetical protein
MLWPDPASMPLAGRDLQPHLHEIIGQTTEKVKQKLKNLHLELVRVKPWRVKFLSLPRAGRGRGAAYQKTPRRVEAQISSLPASQ